jgi:polyisoprenoid-binding protein YceI
MAEINADKAQFDDELRKSLWLMIARYIIEELHDIRK